MTKTRCLSRIFIRKVCSSFRFYFQIAAEQIKMTNWNSNYLALFLQATQISYLQR